MNAKGEFDALTNVKLSDTWKELEKCVDDGLVRSRYIERCSVTVFARSDPLV